MHERVDVDVAWDAGTTEVKDFDSEVDTAHAGSDYEKKIRQSAPMSVATPPADASVRAPIKSSPPRAQTEAFGSAPILRSPALGTAPSRVVPKPADDLDAAPEPMTAKEWTAPTEASPLAKARRASAQRVAASSDLPLAAPEPSVLAPLTPTAPPAPPVEPINATLDAFVPPPTMRIEKIQPVSTVRTILAIALLVAAASSAYAIARKYQSRTQPVAAAPSSGEVTKIVMPTTQSPTLADPVETTPAPVISQPTSEPAKSTAAVQAKPARPVAKKKVTKPKAKAARAAKAPAPSSACTALDCL